MGRFLIILGIILILASTIFFIYILTGLENERYNDLLEDWICESEETFVQTFGGYRTNADGSSGRTVLWTCETPNGLEREVGLQVVLVIAGVFVVPFLTGLFMTIGGSFVAANRAKNRMLQHFNLPQTSGGVTLDLRKGSINYQNMTPEAQAALDDAREQIKSVFSPTSSGAVSNQGTLLTDKLRQLDDAYQQGLISREEYDRTRAAILDAMDD